MGTVHEDLGTFMISCWICRMRNVSDETCRENPNTFILNSSFQKSCCLWDNMENVVEPDRPRMTKCSAMVLHAWKLRLHTHKHSEYVILTVFPQQQWLRERASGLRYTYITCLGFFIVKGRHTFEIISRCCVKLCFGKDNKCLHYYYLAGCPMFPHLPAPISQSCDLSPPIVSISPIFFL